MKNSGHRGRGCESRTKIKNERKKDEKKEKRWKNKQAILLFFSRRHAFFFLFASHRVSMFCLVDWKPGRFSARTKGRRQCDSKNRNFSAEEAHCYSNFIVLDWIVSEKPAPRHRPPTECRAKLKPLPFTYVSFWYLRVGFRNRARKIFSSEREACHAAFKGRWKVARIVRGRKKN